MTRAPLASLVLALLLASCQVAPPAGSAADRAPRAATPRPAASATRAPASAAPSPSPSPAARVAAQLRKPAGDLTVLTGTIAVDASYVVAQGAGAILSHNGGQIVAAGGLNLIGADGGSLLGADGASLVAAGAGNLVAAGAGNLVAAGAGNFALLQAPAAPASAPVAVGTVLPAAGLRLSVVDLRTDTPVALGEDARGTPVHAVYSNALGGFELYVPEALASNLRIDARVGTAADPRLAYQVLVAPRGGPAVIDEDSALVYRYLAESWRARMATLMKELAIQPPRSDEQVLAALYGSRGTANFATSIALLKPLLVGLREGIQTHGLNTDAAIRAAAARGADAVLARVDLSGLTVSTAPLYQAHVTADELAFPTFIEAVRATRAAAETQMRAAAATGTTAAFLQAPPYRAAGARIAKPADVPAYVVAEAFTDESDIQSNAVVGYLLPLGFTEQEARRQEARIWSANTAAGQHLGLLLATDPAVKADFLAALEPR